MSPKSPLDVVLPQRVHDALQPFFSEYAAAPPTYSLLADEHGGVVWCQRLGANELGVGRPCVSHGPDGQLHPAISLPLSANLLERLCAWAKAMRGLSALDPDDGQHRTLFESGELLAMSLASELGNSARVRYFPYLVSRDDLQRWCFAVDAEGVSHKVTAGDMLLARRLVNCLDSLLPRSALDVSEEALERRLFDIVVPRMTEDAMAAKWLTMHDFDIYEIKKQQAQLAPIGITDLRLAAAQTEIHGPKYRQFTWTEVEEIARRAAPYYVERLSGIPHYVGRDEVFWRRYVGSRIVEAYELVRKQEGFCIPDAVSGGESALPAPPATTHGL